MKEALLRNQIADFRESEDIFEATLGLILQRQTDRLDGEQFRTKVRELLDGLRTVLDRFDEEWKVDQ